MTDFTRTDRIGTGYWSHGGTLTGLVVYENGMLGTPLLASQIAPAQLGYGVLSSGTYRMIKPFTQSDLLPTRPIPYADPAERILVELQGVTSSSPLAHAVELKLSRVDSGGAQQGDADFAGLKVRIYTEGGRPLLTSVPEDVELRVAQATRSIGSWTTPGSSQYPDADKGLRDGAGFTESASLEGSASTYVHRSSGAPMARRPDLGEGVYTLLSWQDGPVENGARIVIEHQSGPRVGVRQLSIDLGPLGVSYAGVPAGFHAEAGSAPTTQSGEWVSDRLPLPPYPLTVSVADTGLIGQRLSLSGTEPAWVRAVGKVPLGCTFTVELLNSNDTVLKSFTNGGSATFPAPGSSDALFYRLRVGLTGDTPVRLSELDVQHTYKGQTYTAPPLTAGQYGFTGTWHVPGAAYRAKVSAGTRRMMRHPLMPVGCVISAVDASGGLLSGAAWENALFLDLPPGTARVYWFKVPGSVPQSGPITGRLTGVNWGELETPTQVDHLYTPSILVTVGTVDVTADVVTAGNMGVTLVGPDAPDLDARMFQDGADLTVYLDGAAVEWGKVTGIQKDVIQSSRTLELQAAEPLDYHNIDVELLSYDPDQPERPWPLPDARADPMGYLSVISERSGLGPVSLAAGTAPPAPVVNTDEPAEPYQTQGNTVSQELEMISNAFLLTPYSDPQTRGLYFAPLFGQQQSTVLPVDPRLGIKTAYDLSSGYALVSIGGTSNSVSAGVKKTLVSVTNQGKEEQTIAVTTPTGGLIFSRDVTGWWPREGDAGGFRQKGDGWQQFQVMRESIPQLAGYPLSYNGMAQEQIDSAYPNWKTTAISKEVSETEPGMPQLTDFDESGGSRKRWYRVDGTELFNSWNQRVPFNVQGAGIEIDKIVFRVESPKAVRDRLHLSVTDWPDSLGPCVTGFKAHINDTGAFGGYITFLLQFSAKVINESSVTVMPYVCDPDPLLAPDTQIRSIIELAQIGARKRPHKKNVVQNPFIEEPPPLPGQDATKGQVDAQSHGRRLATGLTFQEAMRMRAGELTYVGALSVRPGDRIAINGTDFMVLEPVRVSITAGDAVSSSTRVAPYGNPLLFSPYRRNA